MHFAVGGNMWPKKQQQQKNLQKLHNVFFLSRHQQTPYATQNSGSCHLSSYHKLLVNSY